MEAEIRRAIVHDYMTQLGGAERVAGRLAERYPDAGLFTTVHRRAVVPIAAVGGRPWHTSFLQPAVGAVPLKAVLPLLPAATASLPLRDYGLVISSSSAFGHHARKGSGALHVCYCHTPPRFLWQSGAYFQRRAALRGSLAPLLALLRRLDLQAARRVDAYVAVSKHIARRIRDVYGRDSRIVHPPVDVERFRPSSERSGRFLVVSRLVAAKRVDLAVEAANRFALPVDVMGTGPEMASLTRRAGPTVRLLGWQPDETVRDALARCEAVVIAGEEDFGLVTVEAQASGRPPVAFAAGGALETVEDGVTGYLFVEQTAEAVGEAILRARAGRLHAASLVDSARRFGVERFFEDLDAAITAARKGAGGSERVAVETRR